MAGEIVRDKGWIIAEAPRTSPAARRLYWGVFAFAALLGCAGAWWYSAVDLTLSHYDARAHLVVARRVIDSLTPGWRQIGAVWLPLPHLLNMGPAQWDWAYHTGAVAVAINTLAAAAGYAALACWLWIRLGSLPGALAAPVILALNPNLLYLQSTPMTEPLLLALSLLALGALDRCMVAIGTPGASSGARPCATAALALVALVWTRYEGWLIAAALIATAALMLARRGHRLPAPLWAWPALAVAAFLILGWASTGQWFQASGFFVPDPELLHQPRVILLKMRTGLVELAGLPTLIAGGAGIVMMLVRSRRHPEALLVLALLAATALPLAAFYSGHPFRVRYLVPTVLAFGALAGGAISLIPRRAQWPAAALLVAATLLAVPPLATSAPMVREAQWETPIRRARETVTRDLKRLHDGTPILASMGSLGHYMQEASHAGFSVRDFLHEGNGDLWVEALRSPARSVRWVLVEEQAEGGDVLASRQRTDPAFLAGFERVSEGGGLALFRRRSGG